jgi:DNA-directed RNA polymerase subunit beta'
VQDVVISEDDCGTSKGIKIGALREGDDVIEPLSARLQGRVTQEDIYDPVSEDIICATNTLITEDLAKAIESVGIEEVMIRSVLTCDSDFGVCQLCYGRNLATRKLVDKGEAVGIMAAQSIGGEPGTQLTLRTFHIGGTASRLIAASDEKARIDGVVKFKSVDTVEHKDGMVVMSRNAELIVLDDVGLERNRYNIPDGSYLKVADGERVTKGHVLFTWDPYNKVILTPRGGTVKFADLIEDETYEERYDDRSGVTNLVVIEHRERKLNPSIQVYEGDTRVANPHIPAGSFLQVKDGATVMAGDILAKVPRKGATKSRDITGGLPRVAELFEARRPKDPAIVSEIDGTVSFGDTERGNRKLVVTDEYGGTKDYLIPLGKHLRVYEGDRVKAGDRLCEGAIDPHDILRIRGENAVQEYMLDEIQQVYRLQGVTINDKHVEVIVSQMLRKVRIKESGGTDFLEGDDIDRKELRKANEKVVSEGGEPATFTPLLLGITKASLTTESFLSAASFQETTKVLSKAAVEGKTDMLTGLKENLIMGNLIPAGTGLRDFRRLKVKDLETDMVEVMEHQANDDFIEF